MKLIVHDIPNDEAGFVQSLATGKDVIVSDDGKLKHCLGCFDCWVKTPGQCIITQDGYHHIGSMFGHANEIIMISESRYGAVSPFVKNIIDRSISYLLPYFTIRQGEMHHQMRYDNAPRMTYYLYGDINADERTTLLKTIKGNMLNLEAILNDVKFYANLEELKGDIQ